MVDSFLFGGLGVVILLFVIFQGQTDPAATTTTVVLVGTGVMFCIIGVVMATGKLIIRTIEKAIESLKE